MIRFHNSIAGSSPLDLYKGKRLLAVGVEPFQTTKYLDCREGKVKIIGRSALNEIFILKIRLCRDSKYTVQLVAITPNEMRLDLPSTSGNKLNVYNDSSAFNEEIKPGSALVRLISNGEGKTSFQPSGLGMQTFRSNSITTTVDVINQGIYTLFFDNANNVSSVLYNYPDQYQQECLRFQDFIGSWFVIDSLGIATTNYIFSETSQGRWMRSVPNTTSIMIPNTIPSMMIPNTTSMTMIPNTIPSMMMGDLLVTDEKGEISEVSGLFVGQAFVPPGMESNNLLPFSWIVHETDYKSYALIGTPNRQELAILSRTQSLDSCHLRKLKKKARKLGYSI